MKLGTIIRNLRKKKGLSQEELSEKINVTRQTISNWELGETQPNPEQLKLLSKEFNISIDELLDNDIKNIVVNKISNTEKLAGIILRLLKIIGISLLIIFILLIILFLFGKYPNRINDNDLEKTTITCIIDNKEYTYEIESDIDTDIIKYAGGDTALSQPTNVEDYEFKNEAIDKIQSYVKSKNGTCKIN